MKTQTTSSMLIAPPAGLLKNPVQLTKTIAPLKNSLRRSLRRRGFLLIPLALALACFALIPRAQAVVPPPDGGYANGNTAEGEDALFSLTNGFWNTALGFEALYHNTTGQVNTATGVRALFSNTRGTYNTAYGYAALYDNTTGSHNTAYGSVALANNITGIRNTAIGFAALHSNEQSYNTATGYAALYNNDVGVGNTATGYAALYNNDFGSYNTAIGYTALYNGGAATHFNTAIGYRALYNGGSLDNTAIGSDALYHNTAGQSNTAIGSGALGSNTTGFHNLALGVNAGENVTTANNVIAIGTAGVNTSNSCFIGNIWNKPGGSQAVYVNSGGKLGVMVSSARFKDEIKPIDQASEAIHRLRPVSFRYKSEIEPTRPVSFGLIAEDVEEINPDLVTRDKEGKPYTVRYNAVNAMLLNEFLKEHRKGLEQDERIAQLKSTAANHEATIAQQQREIKDLTAQLKEQAAQIQKVSAQLELNEAAPRTVVNNH
jgi:trimeric autotransporter adhesin